MTDNRLSDQARALLAGIAEGLRKENLCSVTISVYDTAWVSMVSRGEGKQRTCAFPESFQYIVHHQADDGGWVEGGSLADRVVSSLAGILALQRHRSRSPEIKELENRISKAGNFVEAALQTWNPLQSDLVGVEYLVPRLLAALREGGLEINFPGQEVLLKLQEAKFSLIKPEALYATRPCTLLHTLEAFEGRIDYDRVKHHKVFGSMMGSPASTAAYLMNATSWDEEAAEYLQRVVQHGPGQGGGGMPPFFPIPIFEASWVTSVLLQAGFDKDTLGSESLGNVRRYFEDVAAKQKGLLGFAPGIEGDADDTARAWITLHMLGSFPGHCPVVDHFKSSNGHLSTYLNERNPSLTANCNALQEILTCHEPDLFAKEVGGIVDFLCEQSWTGDYSDKWNLSAQYSIMLLAETLFLLLERWDSGALSSLSDSLLRERVPVTLIQLLTRTLDAQEDSHIYQSSLEAKAYSVLTLKALVRIPWISDIRPHVEASIHSLQQHLLSHISSWSTPAKLWIGKAPYGSPTISQTYCLAASTPTPPLPKWSSAAQNLVQAPSSAKHKLLHLLSAISSIKSFPRWKLEASILEGLSLLPQLESKRSDILPKQNAAKNEYLVFIPCTWVVINNLHGLGVDTPTICDLITLTLHNFRVDEYMESTLPKLSETEITELRRYISATCESDEDAQQPMAQSESFAAIKSTWRAYIASTISHPRFSSVVASALASLRRELRDFLLAHIDHFEQSRRLAFQPNWQPGKLVAYEESDTLSLDSWLANTGGKDVSCPFAYEYLLCLQNAPDKKKKKKKGPEDAPTEFWPFSTSHQASLARDLCNHLSAMSRLYNDVGSLQRDLEEGDLNSVNFREVHVAAVASENPNPTTESAVLLASQPVQSKSNTRSPALVAESPSSITSLPSPQLSLSMASSALTASTASSMPSSSSPSPTMAKTILAPAPPSLDACKRVLLNISARERLQAVRFMNELKAELGEGPLLNSLLLLTGVSELYADIYVIKDLSNANAEKRGAKAEGKVEAEAAGGRKRKAVEIET